MSELPELPRPAQISVGPHPDGAAGAAAQGRRRRGAALGSGVAATVATVAVALCVVLLLPGGGEPRESLIAGDSEPSASAPGDRSAIQTADQMDICDTSQNCRQIRGEGALHLSHALQSAQRAPADAVYCQALGPTYRLVLRSPDTPEQELVVRTICGPMSVGAQDYQLDGAVAQRVVRAHETGEVEPPLVDRSVSEVRFCRSDEPAEASCSAISDRQELDRFSDLVSAGGKQDTARGGCGKTGEVVYAFVRYESGATTTLSADTECGPLTTEVGDHALVTAARERYFTVPTPREPLAAP